MSALQGRVFGPVIKTRDTGVLYPKRLVLAMPCLLSSFLLLHLGGSR